MVPRRASRLRPTPLPAFPCGSMSTSSVRRSAEARLAARLMAVVVFPTPPFWFEIQMTLPTGLPPDPPRAVHDGERVLARRDFRVQDKPLGAEAERHCSGDG